MATASRAHAFRILLALERAGPTLADLLAGDEVAALAQRDRAFLHELLLGTLRHRGALDHALGPLVDRPIAEIDAAPLAALRLGAYQVLRMRVPHRAAVTESVDLARSAAPRSAGFVNAVLRRLAREGEPPAPDPKADPLRWLTTSGSLPAWLAQRWVERLGPDVALSRARAFLDRPPSVVRLNPRVADARGRLEAAGLAPRPLAVPGAWEAAGPALSGLAAEGIVYVQDQGSQLAAHLAASNGRVLDACAAPGGKSAHILEHADVHLTALDSDRHRLTRIEENLARLGLKAAIRAGDAAIPSAWWDGTPFDRILIDAPCSATGIVRRQPDIKLHRRADDIARLVDEQARILDALWPLLGLRGRLVYATCSVLAEENAHQIARFLERHADARSLDAAPPEWRNCGEGGAQNLPGEHGMDGFYYAVLEKVN